MTASSPTLDPYHLLLVGEAPWLTELAGTVETRTGAAVQRVDTGANASAVVRSGAPDCVITEYELGETTGTDLLDAVRETTSGLPVIVATASGSEAIASEVLAAGATDYVPVDETGDLPVDDVLERIERAVGSAWAATTRRDRARQFDTIFADTRTATWVLDPDGGLVRANETARDLVDVAGDDGVEAWLGDPFWTLPWWDRGDGIRSDVRRLVHRAGEGEFGNAVVTLAPDEISSARSAEWGERPRTRDDEGQGRDANGETRIRATDAESPQVLELSVHPVADERGELASIVVEGVDITDRVDLQRDLRRSEELHRVTLNNMTDTVLITDEDGEYTYVCPNVHFIFGYTADEIREMGTINDLLGADLFDRADLAERGVLKNIECSVTDRAGREHTLLVNVREVSIQGGTLLYSCRDVTKRKQREAALATLQATARDFLYAETHREIAQQVVDDTPGVLALDASAVFLFDADDNELQPVASSSAMAAAHGPLRPVHADGTSLPGYSFVEDEPLFFDEVRDADRLANPATDLRSAAYIPLGDRGVFVAGSERVGAFDDVTRELADLLAATAEAAFDRVTRESRLRDQERRLQRQNDELTDLNRINETIREIDQALVRAETRAEIDHTVPELLTADDRFSFAWIGSVDAAGESVEPRAWAGAEQGYLDSRPFPVTAAGAEPAGRTAATGEVTAVANVAGDLRAESWRKDALSRDFLSAVSIPLVYNDLSYGVLTVYAANRDAFTERTRAVLAELGATTASAISAIGRKNALLSASMTRAEFAVEDRTFVLSRLAREAGCRLSYEGGVQQTSDGSYVFVTVEDGPVEAVERAARGLVAVRGVHRISAASPGGVLRLHLAEPFLALELADHGAVFRRASADPETTTFVVDVPESVELRRITALLEESVASVELRSRQSVDRTTERDLRSAVLDGLTDRQLEVVQTAYYSGFFESPRESTGEEVAETLGISGTAFYRHVRSVQRTLFATLFDEFGVPATDAPATGG